MEYVGFRTARVDGGSLCVYVSNVGECTHQKTLLELLRVSTGVLELAKVFKERRKW
jgi:ABC-type transporter Mla MlaB component